MPQEDFQESVTDIVLEPIKAIPKKVIENIWNKKQLEEMFIDAGRWVINYERDGTEESDLRGIAFCEKNMREIANYMFHQNHQDQFRWFEVLRQAIHAQLKESGMSVRNQQNCEKHFLEIIGKCMREKNPITVERSMQQETVNGVRMLNEQNSRMLQIVMENNEFLRGYCNAENEKRQHIRQEKAGSQYRSKVKKWTLAHVHVEGLFAPKEKRGEEIGKLTAIWADERGKYPGWYIPPYEVCQELSVYTNETGLLQSEEFVETDKMFAFVYELVWRYETGMHCYSFYEIKHIYTIWNALEDKDACIEKWFYVGQALLRVFRENGDYAKWEIVYDQLKPYEKVGVNGKIDLQLEKLKYEYHRLNIPAMRIALAKCNPQKEHYEQRLQILGIRVELDEAVSVLADLERLMMELQNIPAEDEKSSLYYRSLEASALQLYSLCMQGVWDDYGEYEQHLGEIADIEEKIESKKELFDWDGWIGSVKNALLNWHVKKYEQKEAFELDREIYTLMSSTNECESAYWFYRMIEKLALPLQCGHVTLLGNMEQSWIEAIADQMEMLGLFLLCRESRSSVIKTLVDRKFLGSLSVDKLENMVGLLIHALAKNIEEMDNQERPHAGGVLSRIRENVPELLIRFMSRCPENQQESALLLLKMLMEDEKLSNFFAMKPLCVAILQNVSEKKKAQMLDTMMQTKIIEHRGIGGHEDGIDIFACYFKKKDIGPLQKECNVKRETIEWLLQIPEQAGYEYQTKVWRLETLDRLGLLDEEQYKKYATLVWNFVDEKTGLPQLTNVHIFVYEVLPYIDAHIPSKSVKQWFLSNHLETQFKDEDGVKGTMGEIPYLDELILLCDNVPKNYWTKKETRQLVQEIVDYWNVLREKLEDQKHRAWAQEEYLNRARKMKRTAAAICRNSETSKESRKELRRMITEMQQWKISTKELEVQVTEDDELTERICDQMLSSDDGQSVDAIVGAYHFIVAHPQEKSSQKLLNEMMRILRYRKMPGLVSAVYIFHNLLYGKCKIMQKKNLSSLDACLLILADSLQVSEACGEEYREILHVRKACMGVAFQMYQREEARCGAGVQRWKQIAEDDAELNEIKHEWVW